jgi:hypothetical protein
MKPDEELAKALLALLCSEPIRAQKRGFAKHYSSLFGTTPEKLNAAFWWLFGKGYACGRGYGGWVEIYAIDEGKEYARSHLATYALSSISDKKFRKYGKSRTKEEPDKMAAATMKQLQKNELLALFGKRPAPPGKRVVLDPY